MIKTVEERFWKKVKKTESCWIWTARRDQDGYGEFQLDGRKRRAHRAAWFLTNGIILDGLYVLHRCDNPSCVNPGHLFLGTDADNKADQKQKGRHAVGEQNGRAKLSADMVREVRRLYKSGKIGTRRLAMKFGITASPIRRIISGKAWRHVTDGG